MGFASSASLVAFTEFLVPQLTFTKVGSAPAQMRQRFSRDLDACLFMQPNRCRMTNYTSHDIATESYANHLLIWFVLTQGWKRA